MAAWTFHYANYAITGLTDEQAQQVEDSIEAAFKSGQGGRFELTEADGTVLRLFLSPGVPMRLTSETGRPVFFG